MSGDRLLYDIAAIRELILAAYTPQTLRIFCQDRPALQPVVTSFGPKDGLDDLAAHVIDYCQTRLLWNELLDEIERDNPRQYARFANRVRGSAISPPASLRPLPKPRHYVYISDDKINTLFPQIPSSFLDSFEPAASRDSRQYRAGIVSAYVEEYLDVGTIDEPATYFQGTVTARCITTDGHKVFWGARYKDILGVSRYVGLSGSLQYIGRSDRSDLDKNAIYSEVTSSNAMFHTYLAHIPRDKLEPQTQDEPPGLARFALYWSLLCGLPLFGAIASWWLIGTWALIPIFLVLMWAVVFSLVYFAPFVLSAILNTPVTPDGIAHYVKCVTDGLYGPEQTYDFLALTIADGKDQGNRVLLGTPIYVAIAARTSP